MMHKTFSDLASRCDPPMYLQPVVHCTAAQQVIETATPDVVLIAVDKKFEDAIDAAIDDHAKWQLDRRHMHFASLIHDQEVGDVGELLQLIRDHRRTIKVALCCPSLDSMGPPLILRLMGCDYIFCEHKLREHFQLSISHILTANRRRERLTHQLFLSYVREDQALVHKLQQRLIDLHLTPWIDTVDLAGGQDWDLTIGKAIQDSDFFLPCLSHRSIYKRGVFQKEIQKALEVLKQKHRDDIYIIPILIENDTIKNDIPDHLRQFHWIDMTAKDGLTKLLQAILRGIERLIPPGQGERVLIVDDCQALCRGYAAILGSLGYAPVLCHNPDEALHKLVAADCPVVILDLMRGKGLEVLQAIQQSSSTTKVILTTMPGDPYDPAVALGVFRCFPKSPHFLSEIIFYVHEALQP
jgi:CheY-like chemotaxis protein